MTKQTERLLHSPQVFSYNWPEGDPRHLKVGRVVPNEAYDRAASTSKVGDVVRTWAGAPGTGYVDARITRIGPSGVYGVEVANTVRELEPWEVR